MEFISTRDKSKRVTAAQAIVQGISEEGGLFVPEKFPQISAEQLDKLAGMAYPQRAEYILSEFLTDFTRAELYECVNGAYNERTFDTRYIAPTVKLSDTTYLLELWHGPTAAFKDMALQLLPRLMSTSAKKVADGKKIVILVATSGDTGKAALEGFKDVENTEIIVFYPEKGVSPMQKLQMVSQEGGNVHVCGIDGNFDDAQSGVKQIFTGSMKNQLAQKGMMYSSANSINWGRLAPQIVYYFSAYCDLLNNEEIALGDKVNFVVPTGNFGNILAAYYAKKMGLPVGKLICASNSNRVLTDFFKTGSYDRNRDFHVTKSPSMDILISSNLERLLFDLYECDDKAVAALMEQLKNEGNYTVSQAVKAKADEFFWGGCCSDKETADELKDCFDRYGYLMDTHTAVALKVYRDYVKESGDSTKTVIASTANPYKFSGAVLSAVRGQDVKADSDFELVDMLEQATKCPVPENLASLRSKAARFTDSCAKDGLESYVKGILGL
ncbi:MAG: threonine synthase [Oscillospiraceae bacterium]|nr:threonine synthase [Oscillospiraceae bacterium]